MAGLKYTYDVVRGQLGRQPLFSDTRPVMCDSIAPDEEQQKEYILRNPVHRLVQHTAPMFEDTTNTPRVGLAHVGINHEEGGWPRDVNYHDPEATTRYRRRIEKDDPYINCVMNLAPAVEHCIGQNNAIDMYETYYKEMANFPKQEENVGRIVNVYHDVRPGGQVRHVSSICWQPDGGRRIAVSYLNVDFDRNSLAAVDCYIWDVEKADKPQETLMPPSPVLDLNFNPRTEHMVVGGLMSGQVCAWDRRAGRLPAACSPPHEAHGDLVRKVLYINSKTNTELFSGSADGTLKWWDTRNMDQPTDEMIIDYGRAANEKLSLTNSYGVSSLDYEPNLPTRFMVGTENGYVITGNRKGRSNMEKLPGKYNAHYGPVWTVERNPGFSKNFMTVGDWTARIWSEDCREDPVMWTPMQRYNVTDGAWSPTRISVLVLTQENGHLSVWDLLRCQRQPVLTLRVCTEPLRRVRAHDYGTLYACGSATGNVYMEELSRNLRFSGRHDKSLMAQVLERETRAQRILEARVREIRLKLRQASEAGSEGDGTSSAAAERDLADVTAEYMATVRATQQLIF